MDLVTLDDVRAAAEPVAAAAVRTPLLPCPWVRDPEAPEGAVPGDARAEALWLKPENLQPIGAFKIRGARNAIARLGQSGRRGVVTYSSGNHAQAVAYVARAAGIPAWIVMPTSTPEIKVANTRAYGAEVVLVEPGQREVVAHRIAAEHGAALVPPFDDPDVIAGAGTIGLEIAADLPAVEVVLVPVSGGGLASGVGVALKALCPRAAVFGVEPELAADAREGLRAGTAVDWPVEQRARTVADGLRAQPSELTFAHLSAVLDDIVTVSDGEIRAAMALLARRAGLVAEPSGAVTTAAWLYRGDRLPRGATVAVVSGGNVDPALLADVLGNEGSAAVPGA